MIGRAALLVSLLCASVAVAAPTDQTGRVAPPPMDGDRMAFLGLSQQPCSVFVAVIDAERRARGDQGAVGPDEARTSAYGAFMSFTDGYLTARNETASVRREAGGNTSHEQRARWLDLFCRANPNAPFYAAAFKLRDYLVESATN